ncbi:MAG: hypothetical protein HYS22_06855 [Deltaproteobacteria bacterium]|nr:hypothetical protein [Deltaproteobacteria bacterium]
MDKLVPLILIVVLVIGLINPYRFMRRGISYPRLRFFGYFLLAWVGWAWISPPDPESSKNGSPSKLYTMMQGSSTPSLPQNNNNFVSTDFAEYNRYLDINSDLTEMQKDQLFDSKFKNGFVKWRGRVVEVDKGTFGGLHVLVKHSGHSLVSDVYLDLKPEEESRASQLRKGQTITYTGRLTGWGNLTDHRVDQGAILEVR